MSGPVQLHGHVFPRPDGQKARCGGPDMCRRCEIEAEMKAALAAAGYAVADKTTLQIALLVLCAARDGQSWHENFLKDFDQAIDGIRAMLAAAGETKE